MPDATTLAGGGRDSVQSVDGTFAVGANQVTLVSIPPLPPLTPNPSTVTVLAAGLPSDGFVYVRGNQGVRVTTGPPPLPPTNSDSTNGVEIIVSELQNVTIQRGLIDGVDQKIEMTPSGITVDAGAMPVTIQSLTQITLSVAGGLSTITLGPQGVTIQGILVQIN
jgi:hypothetical protein